MARREAFRFLCTLSMIPLDSGWKLVVDWWKMCNFLHILDHSLPVNWQPRSVTMVTGTPYLKIHVGMNPDTMAEAEMSSSSMPSSHLVFLSIIVSR